MFAVGFLVGVEITLVRFLGCFFGHTDPGGCLGAMILVLASHTKQFKDSNFNVLKAALGAIKSMLENMAGSRSTKQDRTAVSLVLSPAIEKLGDRKLQVGQS